MPPGPSRESAGFCRASQVQAFRGLDRPPRSASPAAGVGREGRLLATGRGAVLVLYGAALAYFTSIGAVSSAWVPGQEQARTDVIRQLSTLCGAAGVL